MSQSATHDIQKTATLFAGLLLLLTPSASDANFNALAHHWSFDEGPDWHDAPFQSISTKTGVRDYAGQNHARFNGMDGSAFVSGRQYTALAFDGVNDTLILSKSITPVLRKSASLSFWMKTTQRGSASAATAPGILGSNSIQWGWIDEEGKIVVSAQGSPIVRSADIVNDDQWHHVILTRNANKGLVKIFLDGSLSNQGIGPSGAMFGIINRIGHMQNGSPTPFQGTLDQIHLFRGPMKQETAEILYNNHAPKAWIVRSHGESPFSTDSVTLNIHVYDAEQDPITLHSFTQPQHGQIIHLGDGSFTYTASGDYIGEDSFAVVLTDGRGGFTRNTVELDVRPIPHPDASKRTTLFSDFQELMAGSTPIALSGLRCPRLIDWDQDGDQDLLIGSSGTIWRYMNTGTPSAPVFSPAVRLQAAVQDIAMTGNILIALADLTGDGVEDLIAVGSDRQVLLFRNRAAAGQQPEYEAATTLPSPDAASFILPDQRFDAADADGDGRTDLNGT